MRTRNHRVEVYFTDKEYNALLKKVKMSGLTREAFVRKCLAGKQIYEAPPVDYFELIRQLRIIGNNIDQVLVIARSNHFLDAPLFKKSLEELYLTEVCMRQAFGVKAAED